MSFNHFDDAGRAVMVDVGEKEPTRRTAVACATVLMKKETVAAITAGGMKKGDVLGIARIAGIPGRRRPRPDPAVSPDRDYRRAVDSTRSVGRGTSRDATVKAS